ncbi:dTMP kinase [Aestuariivirga sp. YIM B02566]|uniref:dTMP kinase n=1 Tax=Taklimakanibacter albus TaxID=2800327 RepID=A0ACC5R2D5_9HYPH|nr:dTMP kinase [Aestuariivirga sp. YIM B02566]MBK1866763.1 dTMP kinase [Aestuariivirga sp. YIM B02566]
MPGVFITFEGGEGTGKSSHARDLAEVLRKAGRTVVLTREPGGSPSAEEVRALLVTGAVGRWSADAEALLNYAARDSHLRETIRPALARGDLVLCDRFMDSSRAYQGFAGGGDMALIDMLEQSIVGATRPQLTLILDVEPELGLARAKGRAGAAGVEDRFEKKGLAFHRKLREAFLAIAAKEPGRCRVIDSSRPYEAVSEDIKRAVASVVGLA